MAAISFRNVIKRYGKGKQELQVIHGINAEISKGEFIVIVGPSGCGKSTLLRMVAGLEEISGGEIGIGRDEGQPMLKSESRDTRSPIQRGRGG